MKSVQLPTDRAIGRVRGLDFVEMDIKAEGLAVIEALNRAEETSCELKVNKAEPIIAGVRLVVVVFPRPEFLSKLQEPKLSFSKKPS
jgi:RNA recognition motif-containing protein